MKQELHKLIRRAKLEQCGRMLRWKDYRLGNGTGIGAHDGMSGPTTTPTDDDKPSVIALALNGYTIVEISDHFDLPEDEVKHRLVQVLKRAIEPTHQ